MKIVFGIRLATLMLSCAFTCAFANDHLETNSQEPNIQLDVVIDVFAVDNGSTLNDYSEIIKSHRPEYTSKITASAGQPALININTTSGKGEVVQVKFFADKLAEKYDLELVINENDTIANVDSNDINNVLVFIAQIKGVTKLIKVTSHIQAPEHSIANRAAAEQQLDLQRKKNIVEPDQHFFQWDKVWQTNGNMDKLLVKGKARSRGGFITSNSHNRNRRYFVYITNNDNSRPIRGVLQSITKNLSTGMNFVVLPNKTIFLGEWSGVARFKFTDVSFLTEAEQIAINKIAEEQQLAQQQLTFSKQLLMTEPDQHYFQAEKVWHKNETMKKLIQKSNGKEAGIYNQSRFNYLTNNDSNRVIKGIITVNSKHNSVGKVRKNTTLSFTILPNKSIFIGQWDPKYTFNITDVSFLNDAELAALEKLKENE